MSSNAAWETCLVDIDRSRCAGVRIPGLEICLAHAGPSVRDDRIAQLAPGARLDLRGTIVTEELFERIRSAYFDRGRARFGELLCHGTTFAGRTYFDGAAFGGNAFFGSATFADDASFGSATFSKSASFTDAKFKKLSNFAGVKFNDDAVFYGTKFSEEASFSGAGFEHYTTFNTARFNEDCIFENVHFSENCAFDEVDFYGDATFEKATFADDATFRNGNFRGVGNFCNALFTKDINFDETSLDCCTFQEASFGGSSTFFRTQFTKEATFAGARFTQTADFTRAKFASLDTLGPLVAEKVVLHQAEFAKSVTVAAEAEFVSCFRARFNGGADLRFRFSRVEMTEVFFGSASSLSTSGAHFSTVSRKRELIEINAPTATVMRWRKLLDAHDHRPVLTSLRGTDVTELALTDVDLRWCRFADAHHLDKLRIEGDSPFPRPPSRRFHAARDVLFEEHLWRSDETHTNGWHSCAPWETPGTNFERVGAERLAALYRSLRKSLEDGKNEAGAGDFYYGEQEARRNAESTSQAESRILAAYWLVSGYGQRASRALTALLLLVAAVSLLLIAFGLPQAGPTSNSVITTLSTGGSTSQTVTTTADAPTTLPPRSERWKLDRIGTAVRISLGAVVFRDAGQRLTTAGTWTVMAARFLGPVLLALAVLAVRARVKR